MRTENTTFEFRTTATTARLGGLGRFRAAENHSLAVVARFDSPDSER